MKAYEPVTLTHMQAYMLRLVLAANVPHLIDGQFGASASLSALYEQLLGVPKPSAPDTLPGGSS